MPTVKLEQYSFHWLKLISAIVFTGFLIALSFHYYQGNFLNRGYPYNTYLFDPKDRFNDWLSTVFAASSRDPYYSYGAAISTYFPFCYGFTYFLSALPPTGQIFVYLVISAAIVLTAVVNAWKYLILPSVQKGKRRATGFLLAITILCAYPMHFAIDRGNIDIWIAAMCILFTALLPTKYSTSGCWALGIAIALKGYPIVFCLLAIPGKQYRQAVLPIVVAAGLTLCSLMLLRGGIEHNVIGLKTGMRLFYNGYILGKGSIRFSTDPYNAIRLFWIWDHHAPTERMLKIYCLLTTVISGGLCLYVVRARSEDLKWKRTMAVCLVCLIFPNVANDYKLLILFPGLLHFVGEAEKTPRSTSIAICLALLLIPKNYYIIVLQAEPEWSGIGTFINSILVTLLLCMVLLELPGSKKSYRGKDNDRSQIRPRTAPFLYRSEVII